MTLVVVPARTDWGAWARERLARDHLHWGAVADAFYVPERAGTAVRVRLSMVDRSATRFVSDRVLFDAFHVEEWVLVDSLFDAAVGAARDVLRAVHEAAALSSHLE